MPADRAIGQVAFARFGGPALAFIGRLSCLDATLADDFPGLPAGWEVIRARFRADGFASRRVLYFPEVSGFMVYADVQNYVFSPDSSRVFILNDIYSEYYEYSLRLEAYLWDLATGIRYDMGALEGISGSLTPRLVWAPDGESVLFFLTNPGESGEYRISVYRTVFETGEQLILFDEGILSGMDYLYLTNLYWR